MIIFHIPNSNYMIVSRNNLFTLIKEWVTKKFFFYVWKLSIMTDTVCNK